MAQDRRKEFQNKTQQLNDTRQQLSQQNAEIMAQSDNVPQAAGEADPRQKVIGQLQQLDSIQNQIQQQANSLTEKANAGMDNVSYAPIEKNGAEIDDEKVKKLEEIHKKYREGKANFDNRIIDNFKWWQLRHYGKISTDGKGQTAKETREEPPSAWLFNSVDNKHADYMDNFPEASCLPIEEQDREEASKLSKIVPCVFENNNYEDVYSKCAWDKLICGASCKQVIWDNSKMNGLGDIAINQIDILNIAWEPGVTNIQDSPYFFNRTLMNNDKILNLFGDSVPKLKDKLGKNNADEKKYILDDDIDTKDCSFVVDCYYKAKNSKGKTIVHLVKYINDLLLFASVNEQKYKERGYYDHGKYPFAIEALFPMKGTPIGFGYVDVMKGTQASIDDMDAAFLKNTKLASKVRYAVNSQGSVNVKDLADYDKDVIEIAGSNLDDGNFRQLITKPLDSISETYRQNKIEEMKQTSNNRDVANGTTGSGVTAASAIAALQEAGSKTSRDELKASYRAFKEEAYLVIELIRQFYDETRYFRIVGNEGQTEFIGYNNHHIKSTDDDSRMPVFDISVKPQKSSAYSRLAQNELMLQLFQMGLFNPQLVDQAVIVISNMDFEGKESILQKISQNGTLLQKVQEYQQLLFTMAQQLDEIAGTQYTLMVQQAINSSEIGAVPQLSIPLQQTETNSLGAADTTGNNIVDNAKAQTRKRTEVS